MIMLSTCPLIMVIGVFNSCEAAANKYWCCLSSSSICSISCFNCLFAVSSFFTASDNSSDIVFKLSASIPISSDRAILHFHVISSFAIRLETLLISMIGLTIKRLQIHAPKNETVNIRIKRKGNSFSNALISS